MTSQIYITGQPSRNNINSLLQTDPITALKNLIILSSQEQDVSDFINLVIQTVFRNKNKELLKLFYFYVTLIPKKHNGKILAEVLLLTNQIRNDIQSVNEYTRGIAMQCVASFIHLDEICDNFYKPIQENLKHKHSYVRRWAAHALTEFYLRYPGIYKNVPDLVYNTLLEERDPYCMRQMVIEVNRMGGVLIKPLVASVNEVALEIIVDLCDDMNYVLGCVEKVPFHAGLKILRNIEIFSNKKIVLDQVIPLILSCSRKKEAIYEMIDLDCENFKGYLNYFIDVVVEDDSIILFPGCLDFLFAISSSNDLDILSDVLLNLLRTNEGSMKILIIKKLRVLFDDFGLKNNEIIEEMKTSINHEDPAIAYESLNFLSNQKDVLEIIQLEKIKYGKIFRKALNIIQDKIENEDQVLHQIELFEEGLKCIETSKERIPILESLFSESTPYLGAPMALFFDFIVKNIALSSNTRARIIALIIKYLKMGEKTEKIDKSTYLTISMCLKDICCVKQSVNNDKRDDDKIIVKKGSVFDPILFSNIKGRQKNDYQPISLTSEVKIKKQLTGITDPILVIATVTILQFEVVLSLYLRNQTNSLLQNFSIDLTTSQNLNCFSAIPLIPNLNASTTHETIIRYKIVECVNSFICGSLTFNFPGDQGQYSGSIYTLNLSEITLNISNFLTPPKDIDFIANWTNLEWENTYTVKLSKEFPIQKLVTALKGKIVNEQSLDFTVCNILCATRMGDFVLVNVMMYENDSFHMECRIRGKSGNVVKSISGIIGDCVKENKQ